MKGVDESNDTRERRERIPPGSYEPQSDLANIGRNDLLVI